MNIPVLTLLRCLKHRFLIRSGKMDNLMTGSPYDGYYNALSPVGKWLNMVCLANCILLFNTLQLKNPKTFGKYLHVKMTSCLPPSFLYV